VYAVTPEQFAKMNEIFSAVLKLPASERSAYLEAHCENAEMVWKIESMLAHDEAAEHLEIPALGRDFHIGDTEKFDRQLLDEIESDGRFRILSTVGEGGFGTVFRAEQIKPVLRTVALKVVKLGMDSKRVLARFESERQTLAMMDHTGIAKLFEAGRLPSGRPYFVMEYVDGVPITEYCLDGALRTRNRLRLFVRVCNAVQHAHQKGIIHRDLKPSNVLVVESDGVPHPKVIDFGIARAVSGSLPGSDDGRTALTLTELGQPIGTLGYMSPEQTAGEQDIDTRTDIYSLGALLYEMLTGKPTIESETLKHSDRAEIIRHIREVEPKRPSKHVAALSGDLDWILMTALEKTRDRRYATASALSEDVQRFLGNQPISARAPGTYYRIQKFSRRNRVALGAVALIVIALVGTTAGLVRSLEAESRARTEARIATEINTFLNDDLLAAAAPEELGSDIRVRDALDVAAARIESRFENLPEVEAAVRMTLGRTYARLADYANAQTQLERSKELALAEYGPSDLRTLSATHELGLLATLTERYAESESMLREAYEGRRHTLGMDHPATLETEFAHAIAIGEQGRYKEAERLFVDVLERSRRVLGPDHEQTLVRARGLGVLYLSTGDMAKARPIFEDAYTRLRTTIGVQNPATLLAMQDLALTLRSQGEHERAYELLTEVFEISTSLRGETHPGTLMTMNSLGALLSDMGEQSQAETLLVDALAKARSTMPSGHTVITRLELQLADVYDAQGMHELAEPLFLEAVTSLRDQLGDTHPWTLRAVGQVVTHYRSRGMPEVADQWESGDFGRP
jgi:tetratricopeptide (TPR) repeat protein